MVGSRTHLHTLRQPIGDFMAQVVHYGAVCAKDRSISLPSFGRLIKDRVRRLRWWYMW